MTDCHVEKFLHMRNVKTIYHIEKVLHTMFGENWTKYCACGEKGQILLIRYGSNRQQGLAGIVYAQCIYCIEQNIMIR